MDPAQRALLADFGIDPDDPEVVEAAQDTATHMNLIETLVCLRTGRDLTQKAVADRMGTTQSRVSNFERIGGDPRLSTIFRYARAVGARVHMNAAVSSTTTFTDASGTPTPPTTPLASPSKGWLPVGQFDSGLVNAKTA